MSAGRRLPAAGPIHRTGRLIALTVAAVVALTASLAPAVAAAEPAGPPPAVVSLSSSTGPSQCAPPVTITGTGLSDATRVYFGTSAVPFTVVSPSRIVASPSSHKPGTAYVRVATPSGQSGQVAAARYTVRAVKFGFATTKLNCGMTAKQARANSEKYRAHAARYEKVRAARRSSTWTPAMGRTAVARATAWTGLSYSFAGGSASGPTYGVNSGDGGWWDSRVWGFDCSGLTLYAWAPYTALKHDAAAQYKQRGTFHPTVNELMPGDLLFYSSTGRASGIGHVAMYAGAGQIVQAPQSGYTIGVSELADTGPWTTPFFAATRPLSHGRQGAAPVITSLSATSGPSTAPVTITVRGTNLTDVSSVLVSGSRSYTFTPVSATQLRITLPQHAAGRVSVRIGGAWGVSNWLPFTYTDPVPPPSGPAPSPVPSAVPSADGWF